jgi:hypothetical protein
MWHYMADPPIRIRLETSIDRLILPPINYSRTLFQMRDAGKYDRVSSYFNGDSSFENRDGEDRDFFMVCFHRPIRDAEDSAESELISELDKLHLEPEGLPELLAVGEYHPDIQRILMQRELMIVARKRVWRDPSNHLVCPVLHRHRDWRHLLVDKIISWEDDDYGRLYRFLVSRKCK